MLKYDIAVLGRTVMTGVVAGVVTGTVVPPLLVLWSGVSRSDVDWGGFVQSLFVGLAGLGIMGAVVGPAAGIVAGLLLFLVSPWLTGWPGPAVRVVAAAGCAAGFGVPVLVVGLGWDLWLSGPWTELAFLLMAVAAVVGAWKGPYLISGPSARRSAASAAE